MGTEESGADFDEEDAVSEIGKEMGAKFANLQIRCKDMEQIKALCPEMAVLRVSEGWITIVGKNIVWGTAQKEARRISKVLPYSILATEYFDDDYVEFSIYKDGKKTGYHVPAAYEGFARKTGKPAKFLEAFDLPEEAQAQLKVAFKEQEPEVSVRLMESILGCALWADFETIADVQAPDRSYFQEYIARVRKKEKLRNRTKLTLIDELPGDFFNQTTIPLVRYETPDGKVKSFWDIKEGKFTRLFSYEADGRVDGSRAFVHQYDKLVFCVNRWTRSGFENSVQMLGGNGTSIGVIPTENRMPVNSAFLGETDLFYDGICYDCEAQHIKWDLELGVSGYGVEAPVSVSENQYVIVYDTGQPEEEEGRLAVFADNGTLIAMKVLPDLRHWACPVVNEEYIYMACAVDRQESVLTCFDKELKEQWSIPYQGAYHHAEPMLDEQLHMLYFQASYNTFLAVDLTAKKIVAAKELDANAYAKLFGVIPKVGIVVMTGDTTIEVWDKELIPVSRHKTKGEIRKMVSLDGSYYLLTLKDGDWEKQPDSGDMKNSGIARLYELT